MTDVKIRLQKFMAESGVASRRKSEELIAAGKVKVNGKTACVGDKVNPKTDKVVVAGKKLSAPKENVYIMLNKPRGFITTMSDEMDRKCVAELVSDIDARIYPVGRLDRESEGLLLMTNDGEFAHRVISPAFGRAFVPSYIGKKSAFSASVLPSLITTERLTGTCLCSCCRKTSSACASSSVIMRGRKTATN